MSVKRENDLHGLLRNVMNWLTKQLFSRENSWACQKRLLRDTDGLERKK
jgi:hypothetical protein